MAKGGDRVGGGRPKRVAVVPVEVLPDNPLLVAPMWMPDSHRALWVMLAPAAIAQQTLTAQKVTGLAELCGAMAIKRDIEASLSQLSAGSPEWVVMLTQHAKYAQRVESGLARFRLTGDGRPDAAAAKKATVKNPWAA